MVGVKLIRFCNTCATNSYLQLSESEYGETDDDLDFGALEEGFVSFQYHILVIFWQCSGTHMGSMLSFSL